tara:strand:+ start:811 stop:1029 length:219 start_codon:yes stop_codon:yes gene_type:complete
MRKLSPTLKKNEIDSMIQQISIQLTIIFIGHFLTSVIDGDGEVLDIKIIKKMLYITISLVFYYVFVNKFIKK